MWQYSGFFFSTSLHLLHWNLVYHFVVKSYSSNSLFSGIDLLFFTKVDGRIMPRLRCSCSICLQFLIEIWHFVSHVYFDHISLPSIEKKIILEFAFEVNLSIRLQKYANAWSDNHISANKCYDNIFFPVWVISHNNNMYIKTCKNKLIYAECVLCGRYFELLSSKWSKELKFAV
jgi:hypothetical protein